MLLPYINYCILRCPINPASSQKPLQDLSKKVSKWRLQKLDFAYIYIYIYIANWSNPPASDQVKIRLPSPLLHLSSEDSFRIRTKRPSPGRRFPSSADPFRGHPSVRGYLPPLDLPQRIKNHLFLGGGEFLS